VKSFDTFTQRVGGKWAASPITWIALSPVGVFGVLLGFGLDQIATSGLQLLAIATLGFLASGLVFIGLGHFLLPSNTARKPRPITALFHFAISSAAAGSVTGLLIQQSGLLPEYDFIREVLARVWYGIYWSTLATLVLASFEEYRLAASRLEAQISQSLELSKDLSKAVLRVRNQMIESVKKTLSEAVDKSDPKNLNRLADTVMKPLTDRLNEQKHQPVFPAKPLEVRIGIRRTMAGALTTPKFIPLAVLAGTLYSAVWTLSRLGLAGVLNLTVLALVLGGTLGLIRLLKSASAALRVLLLALGGAASYLLGYGVESFSPADTTVLGLLNVGGWLIALFAVFMGETEDQRAQKLVQFEQLAEKTSWLEQRLQQEVWVESRKLTRIVHGTVQGKIRAAAISDKTPSDRELQQLLTECLELIDRGAEPIGLDEFLSQSRRLWSEALEIADETDPLAIKVLEQDPIALAALIEVIREALTNAVRHGKAKRANISISLPKSDMRQIEVCITNDGLQVDRDPVKGVGSSILDEVTSSWELKSEGSKVSLSASIPFDSTPTGQRVQA